jgi:hypothetical protein
MAKNRSSKGGGKNRVRTVAQNRRNRISARRAGGRNFVPF